MMGEVFDDIPVRGEARFTDCGSVTLKASTVMPTNSTYVDALKKCLPQMPSTTGAVFDVVTQDGALVATNFDFGDLDTLDGHARRCLESTLGRRVELDADEPPVESHRVVFRVSKGGANVSRTVEPLR